jgi:glucose/mannose-6-phosphate isomerase
VTLSLDSIGMWEATMGLPEQVGQAAADATDAFAPPPGGGPAVRNVVACGMGGSGIAGDVLAAVAGPRLAVPVSVVKSYSLPGSVGPGTLVFAVSFSGETEEVLATADAAWAAGATVVAVTGPGSLREAAAARDAAVVPVPQSIPQPRAAIGALAVPPLVVLGRLGLLEGVEALVADAVEQLRNRRDQLDGAASPAAAAAACIGRTMPLVHGSDGPAGVAAQRWRTQINENAKALAMSSVHPELCHNELAGWGVNGDLTRQLITLVTLRCPGEHPQVARRFELVTETLREVVADVVPVRAGGEGPLAHLLDLALFGDAVSLHLAAEEGVDPGPVPALAELKEALRR